MDIKAFSQSVYQGDRCLLAWEFDETSQCDRVNCWNKSSKILLKNQQYLKLEVKTKINYHFLSEEGNMVYTMFLQPILI